MFYLSLLAAMPLVVRGGHASEIPGELLFFPEVTGVERFGLERDASLDEQDIFPGIDIFYSADRDRFRFLLEWLVDRRSQEVQRLQFGWRWRDTSFWLGRFHNPIGYWNTHYHHGAYLMTTISRPGAMSYESAGGPLPTHLTGLYVEGTREVGRAIEPPTTAALQAYAWPGNIRELEHVIERALILSRAGRLELGDWFAQPEPPAREGEIKTLEASERDHILHVLRQTSWRISGPQGAAQILGLNPTTLKARMKKLGITRPNASLDPRA